MSGKHVCGDCNACVKMRQEIEYPHKIFDFGNKVRVIGNNLQFKCVGCQSDLHSYSSSDFNGVQCYNKSCDKRGALKVEVVK